MDNQLDTNVLLLKIEHLEQLNKFLLEQKEMSEIRLKQQIGMYKMTLDFFTNQNQTLDSKDISAEERVIQQQKTKNLFVEFTKVQSQEMQIMLDKLNEPK